MVYRLYFNYVLSFGGKGEAIESAKLSPRAVKNAAKSPISSVVKSCEIKIAKLLARAIKLEPDKLDKFMDSSPLKYIIKKIGVMLQNKDWGNFKFHPSQKVFHKYP